MFSFMLCIDIMRQAGDISDAEWNFFLRGAAAVDKVRMILITIVTKLLLLFSSLQC